MHRVCDRYEAQQQTILGSPVGFLTEPLDSSLTGVVASLGQGPDDAEGAVALGCMTTNTQAVMCGCRVASCKQGAFVADALRYAADSDMAIVNAGSLRSALSSGSISRGDLFQLLPFANELVRVQVSGTTLRAALANSISQLADLFMGDSGGSGRFAQVSSTLRYDWYYAGGVPTLSTVSVWSRSSPGCSMSSPINPPNPTSETLPMSSAIDYHCWSALNETATYTLVVNQYIAVGGDEYSMLANLPGAKLGINEADATATYLSAWQGAGAEALEIGSYSMRIVQQPDLIVIELGLACKTHKVNTEGLPVLSGDREECDHFHLMVELINDKSDGFMDDLLPNSYIHTEEARIGCVESLGLAAVKDLASLLPNMLAVIGPICSNDVRDISGTQGRSLANFDGLVISSSSTAPSLDDEDAYPKVARLSTSEVFIGRGSSLLAERWAWKRVAVVHDDSIWASEGAQAFIDEHEERSGIRVLNGAIDQVTRGFAVEGFTEEHAKQMLVLLDSMDAKIVYVVAQPRIQSIIWSTIYDQNLLSGEGYAWLTAWPSQNAFLAEDGSIVPNAVRGAEGAIGIIESSGEGTELHESYMSLWRARASPAGCDGTDPSKYCDVDGSATDGPPGYSMQVCGPLRTRRAVCRSPPQGLLLTSLYPPARCGHAHVHAHAFRCRRSRPSFYSPRRST